MKMLFFLKRIHNRLLITRTSYVRNSILLRVNSEVTLTVSCLRTSSEGGGRNSSIIVTLPLGASSNLADFFIILSPFSPVACANDTDAYHFRGDRSCFGGLIRMLWRWLSNHRKARYAGNSPHILH